MTFRPVVRAARGALSGAFFLLYGLLASPFVPVLACLSKRQGRFVIRWFYRGFVFFAGLTGLYKVSVSCGEDGREPAASSGRVVVMNHVSLIDICVLLANLGDSVCIAKAATKRNPFLGMVVRRLFIANDAGGPAELAEASEYLAKGVNVVVFPQGTRGGTEFRRGAARLALRARVPVEAWRIDYDPVVLAKGQPWWDVGARTVRITLRRVGTIPPDGPDTRPGAVALTKRIRIAIAPIAERRDLI